MFSQMGPVNILAWSLKSYDRTLKQIVRLLGHRISLPRPARLYEPIHVRDWERMIVLHGGDSQRTGRVTLFAPVQSVTHNSETGASGHPGMYRKGRALHRSRVYRPLGYVGTSTVVTGLVQGRNKSNTPSSPQLLTLVTERNPITELGS